MTALRLGLLLTLLLCPQTAAAVPIDAPETARQPFTGLAPLMELGPTPAIRDGRLVARTAFATDGTDGTNRWANRLAPPDDPALASSFQPLRPAIGAGHDTGGDDPRQATASQVRETPQSAQDQQSARNEARLRDLVRLFVTHSTVAGPAGSPSQETSGQGSSPASLLLETVLDITFDAEAVSLIHEIVSPALSPLTIMNFSVPALGNFIIVFLREASGFSIVDLDSGSRISMRDTPGPDTPIIIQAHQGDMRSGDRAGANMTFAEFVDLLREYFFSYVLHPLTLTMLAMAGLFWVAWRLQGRNV